MIEINDDITLESRGLGSSPGPLSLHCQFVFRKYLRNVKVIKYLSTFFPTRRRQL